jgi:hypothetical protein
MYTSFLQDQNLLKNDSSYRKVLRTVFLNLRPSDSVLRKGRIRRETFSVPTNIFHYFDILQSNGIYYNSVLFFHLNFLQNWRCIYFQFKSPIKKYFCKHDYLTFKQKSDFSGLFLLSQHTSSFTGFRSNFRFSRKGPQILWYRGPLS